MTGSDDDTPTRSLPAGSVVPGADIWDDDSDDERGAGDDDRTVDMTSARETIARRAADHEWNDDTWLADAQVVAHVDDDGAHDGSRGIEADDDETTEAFGTKLQRWGTTSVIGASLSGLGIGLGKIFNPRETTQIEIQVDDDSDDHLDPVEVKLGEDPDHSVALLRPWLRDRRSTTDTSSE